MMLRLNVRPAALRRSASALGLVLAAGLATSLALSGAAMAQASTDKVLATVNGATITEADVAVALEDLGASLPQQATDEQKRKYVLDYLVDLKIVSSAADKDKIGDAPAFKKRLAYARERLLMEELLGTAGKQAASDAAIAEYYEKAKAANPPQEEVRARHILTETEDQAKAAAERLKKGEDFVKLAAELSKDPGSGKEGGDLGFFTKDRMVPEFSEIAFKLEAGKVSDPVKSQFGWHIIKLEERRTRPFPALDDVKDQIQRALVEKAQTDAVLKLRTEAKIERTDAAPAVPPPATPKP